MSGDRELLEAAAKAAGVLIDYSATNGGGWSNTGFDGAGNAVLDWHNYKTWNPLTSDGDALRLAVSLHMTVRCYMGSTCAQIGVPGQKNAYEEVTDHGDPAAATRRAIVRAAASLATGAPT